MEKPIIFGADGRPAASSREVLSEEARAAIRQQVDAHVAELVDSATKKWKVFFGFMTVVATFFGFATWKFWAGVPQAVQDQLLEPRVAKSVETILENRSSQFIEGKIAPLDERVKLVSETTAKVSAKVDPLENRVKLASETANRLEAEVSRKQKQLSAQQAAMEVWVSAQRQAVAAKAGDLEAYNKLIKDRSFAGEKGAAAIAALHEVETAYNLDAAQLLAPILADSISRNDPGFSMDELVVELAKSRTADYQIGALNTIKWRSESGHPPKGVAEELYRIIEVASDLRVRARAVVALNNIAEQNFRPLDKDAVEAWWKLHSAEPSFRSPYGGLVWTVTRRERLKYLTSAMGAALADTVKKEPGAIYARSLLANVLIARHKFEDAKAELDEVEKVNPEFRWLHVVKAQWLEAQGRHLEAVVEINSALERSPAIRSELDLFGLDSASHLPGVKGQE